jgi:GntR family transcriptional regulator, transcriptional repressor for pyruvate dehydrogenase complex
MHIPDELTYRLERMIFDGPYKPGDRIPAERELSQLLGASRSKTRETIAHLEAMGLLKTAPQSGTYVCDFQQEASFDLLLYLMENHHIHDPQIYRSLIEFREVSEVFCVRSLYDHPEKRNHIADQLEAITGQIAETPFGDTEEIIRLDFQFHWILVNSSENIIFRTLFRTSRTVHAVYTRLFYEDTTVVPATVAQQTAFTQALRSAECEQAVRSLEHLLQTGAAKVETAGNIHDMSKEIPS